MHWLTIFINYKKDINRLNENGNRKKQIISAFSFKISRFLVELLKFKFWGDFPKHRKISKVTNKNLWVIMFKNKPPFATFLVTLTYIEINLDQYLQLTSLWLPEKSKKNAIHWYESYIWRLRGDRKKKRSRVSKFGS